MNETRPHWAAWTEKLIITLESAISLSLDREPKDGARRDGPGPDTEFLDRWRLVEHLIASGKLHVSGLHVCYGPRIIGTVNAREFAAALAHAGVALPGEFVRAWLGETLRPVQAPESASIIKPTTDKVEAASIKRLKKAALIAKHEHHWPTIKNDFRHSDENDLAKVAGLEDHGFWNETAALIWAEERDKLTDASKPEEIPLVTAWRRVKNK